MRTNPGEQCVRMGIGRQLAALIEASGLSEAEIARRCGIEPRAFNHYVKEKRSPDFAILLKICDTLHVTPNWLLNYHAAPDDLLEDEKELLSGYRALDAERRRQLLSIVKVFASAPQPGARRPFKAAR